MQSMFRLKPLWCSDQLAPKMSEKMRGTPVLGVPMLNKLKRKYSDIPEHSPPSAPQLPKKSRPNTETAQHQPVTVAPPPMGTPASLSRAATPAAEDTPTIFAQTASSPRDTSPVDQLPATLKQPSRWEAPVRESGQAAQAEPPQPSSSIPDMTNHLTALQQVIENELNMQILFKHNELRLIEQELAKCQIGLEQLRRCELRPYPGTDAPSPAVSAGVGPAISPPPGLSRPSHPAPHGVTDGPYSRHYRQWLLHDPRFDPMSPQALAQMDSPLNASGRSTRNSATVRKVSAKSVGPSNRSVDPLQSIPNYPSAPVKDKSAPLVLRRSTDNQLVKLICNNCQRGNFSSIQGFLNHCRIAHKVDYKSHDLAAIDCGRPLDESEMANLPAETHSNTPKPAVSRASTTTTHTPARRLVHPLNTGIGAAPTLLTPVSATPSVTTPVAGLSSPPSQLFGSVPFKSSSQVPRLSAFFAKHQIGGDLEQAASRAKQRIELYSDDELLSPLTPDASSPVTSMAGCRTVAGAMQSATALHGGESVRPPSRKGYRQPAVQRPRPSPLVPSDAFLQTDHFQSPRDIASTSSLSPHGVDSNPGLVSDHEDDDHGSASEEEAPHSDMPHPPLPTVAQTCGDHMEIDVTDDEEIGQHGVIIRRNSMLSSDAHGLGAAGSPSRKLGMAKGGK